MDNELIVECPNCYGKVIIKKNDVNCCIFRHGVWKSTNSPLDPHASKEVCDNAVRKNLILGCGLPFRLELSTMCTVVCDYI